MLSAEWQAPAISRGRQLALMAGTEGGMDVDSQGNIYIGGQTDNSDLPVTSGVFEPVCTGCVTRAGFLAKIQKPGPRLERRRKFSDIDGGHERHH